MSEDSTPDPFRPDLTRAGQIHPDQDRPDQPRSTPTRPEPGRPSASGPSSTDGRPPSGAAAPTPAETGQTGQTGHTTRGTGPRPPRPPRAPRPLPGDAAADSGEAGASASASGRRSAGEDADGSSDGGPSDGGADVGERSGAKRRRGSRGGRKRRRLDGEPDDGQTGAAPIDAEEYARRPADLPDSPHEGVPSPEAAARANVTPKIGDRRPAPSLPPVGAPPATARQAPGRSGGRPPRGSRPASTGPGGSGSATTLPEGRPGQGAGQGPERIAAQGSADAEARRSRRRGREKPPRAGERDADSRIVLSEEEIAERRRGRERNGKPLGRYLMCVHTRAKATQIAVLEGRALIEHYVSKPSDNVGQIHGNIYLGKVQNVLPGMEAAFVDIGTPKNAVLYRGDIQFDPADVIEGSGGKVKKNDIRIEQLLKNGQLLVCQVTKNPIGSKGARLTQEVSLPGRFVVLIPNSDTYGISKRLPDDERKRLRRILDEVRPAGHGLIVRTAAEGATADELQRDVLLLSKQWAAIEAKAAKAKGPTLLYKEPDMAVRVIREEFNRNYRGIVIDDRELFEEVRSYVESITPELADRVEFHDPATEPLPLFERHHIHEQLHKAIERKVWLPSGGSLIIERTEALTVIDVNTGKNVGSSSLEETVFRNNLEAADEIARQLRLRDIGGIIVIDFIDMETRANREAVVTAFRDALARDKTRSQVFDISELGLVEMTRKRISEGLVESLSSACPMCDGRGMVFDEELLREHHG